MKTWRGRQSKNRNVVVFIVTFFHVNECLKCSDVDDCSAAIQHAGRFWSRRLKLMLRTELNSHFNDSISCVGVRGGSDQLVVELVSFTSKGLVCKMSLEVHLTACCVFSAPSRRIPKTNGARALFYVHLLYENHFKRRKLKLLSLYCKYTLSFIQFWAVH